MEKCMSPEFRVSFPQVFEAKSFQGAPPKFSLVMLFDKGIDLSKLKELAKNAINEKWPDANKRPKGLKNPFRDGDAEKPGVEGYENAIFITASSKMKPGVVDSNLVPIISADDFYAGCFARATLTAYAYDTAGNKGVAFGLQNIQKLKDGDSFSGRSKAEDDFDIVDGGGNAKITVTASAQDDMFG